MSKRNVQLAVKTSAEVSGVIEKVRSIVPFRPTRSTVAHNLLEYMTDKIEEGSLSVQDICGESSNQGKPRLPQGGKS